MSEAGTTAQAAPATGSAPQSSGTPPQTPSTTEASVTSTQTASALPQANSQMSTTESSTTSTSSSTQQVTGPSTQTKWYDSLPDPIKTDQNVTKFESVEELAKGYINASKLIGREKIPMPQTDAEMREVQLRLGLPDTPSGYKFGGDAGATEPEFAFSPEPETTLESFKDCFRNKCHKFGFTQQQAKAIYDTMVAEQRESVKLYEQRVNEQLKKVSEELKAEWGERHDVNMVIASNTLVKAFGNETARYLESLGLGRHKGFILGLHKLGSRALEELGLDKGGSALMTPSDLDGEILKLQQHKAYLDKKHPEHDMIVKQVTELFKRRHPEQKSAA